MNALLFFCLTIHVVAVEALETGGTLCKRKQIITSVHPFQATWVHIQGHEGHEQ